MPQVQPTNHFQLKLDIFPSLSQYIIQSQLSSLILASILRGKVPFLVTHGDDSKLGK